MFYVEDNFTPKCPKGEGGYEDIDFQKDLGGTAACNKRLLMATKGCVQMESNAIYCYNIWFSGEKTAEEEMNEGVDYFGLVERRHKVVCLDTL